MQIAPYAPRHRDTVAALWLASWKSKPLDIDDGTTVADLATRIDEDVGEAWPLWLAVEGEAVLGMLALKPAIGCLDQLFVAPEGQGRGVGAALMAFAKGRLPAGMWLRTAEANSGARRFYERHGFRHTESGVHERLGYRFVIYRWP